MSVLLFSTSEVQALRTQLENSFKTDRLELERNSISLDQDPTKKSPSQLYIKLFQAREYTNRAGVVYSKYLKMNILAKKLFTQRTEERRQIISALFKANTQELAKFRSNEEKNKYCESLIPPEEEEKYVTAKLLLEESIGYLSFFRLQFDLVKDIKSDILTQLGIIKAMMSLGEFGTLANVNGFVGEFDANSNEKLDTLIPEGSNEL